MPYTQTNRKIEAFNRRFGTNISLRNIHSEARRLGSYDTALRGIFCKEYRKVLGKDLMFANASNNMSPRMLNEFNDYIVTALLSETPNASAVGLSADMGLKTLGEKYGMLEGILREHEMNTEAPAGTPKTLGDVFTKNYLNGNVTIQDMLTMVNSYDPRNKKNDVSPVTLVSCVEALRRATESRSFLWKIFHPFRSYSERRFAQVMERSVRAAIGNEGTYNAAATAVNRGIPNLKYLAGTTKNNVYIHPVYNENDEIVDVLNKENYNILATANAGDHNNKDYVDKDNVKIPELKEELYAPGERIEVPKQIHDNVLDNPNAV